MVTLSFNYIAPLRAFNAKGGTFDGNAIDCCGFMYSLIVFDGFIVRFNGFVESVCT